MSLILVCLSLLCHVTVAWSTCSLPGLVVPGDGEKSSTCHVTGGLIPEGAPVEAGCGLVCVCQSSMLECCLDNTCIPIPSRDTAESEYHVTGTTRHTGSRGESLAYRPRAVPDHVIATRQSLLKRWHRKEDSSDNMRVLQLGVQRLVDKAGLTGARETDLPHVSVTHLLRRKPGPDVLPTLRETVRRNFVKRVKTRRRRRSLKLYDLLREKRDLSNTEETTTEQACHHDVGTEAPDEITTTAFDRK